MGGTQDNGTIMIDPNKTTNTKMTGIAVGGGDGGHCSFSILSKDVMINSIYFGSVYRSTDYGTTKSKIEDFYSKEMINYSGVADVEPGNSSFPASFVTPILLNEKIDDTNSKDTIVSVADEDLTAGSEYTFFSSNKSFPIKVTLSKNVKKGDTLKQQDIIQTRFFVGFAGAVWMTKDVLKFDKNPTWFKVAEFSKNYSNNISNFAISNDGNVLYFSTRLGQLYRISNLNMAYDSLTADVRSNNCVLDVSNLTVPFANRAITSVNFDPRNTNNLLVTLGNYNNASYIYTTGNALDSMPEFKSRQGDLPKIPVYSGIIEMSSTKAIIGTEYGIYTTSNIFATNVTWTEENTNMGRVPVYMIKQQTAKGSSNHGTIYLATHGRGFFKTEKYLALDVEDNNIVKEMPKTFRIYPNPIRDNANIAFTSKTKTNVTLTVYDLKGQVIDKVDYNNCVSGINNIRYNNRNLNNGTYIFRLLGENINYSSKIIVSK